MTSPFPWTVHHGEEGCSHSLSATIDGKQKVIAHFEELDDAKFAAWASEHLQRAKEYNDGFRSIFLEDVTPLLPASE